MQEAQRERIADFLRAGTPISTIKEVTGASLATIYRVKNKVADGKTLKHPSRGPPANKKLTAAKLGRIRKSFDKNPTQSIRKTAKKLGIGATTLRTGLKHLGYESRVRPHRHILTGAQKDKRVERGKVILNWLKRSPGQIKVFSDEKNFYVDQAYNRRNDRAVVRRGEEVPKVMRTKHPASVMVLAVIGDDGQKMPLHFFESGLKVNTEVYLDAMTKTVKPWLSRAYPEGNYTWTQDGAPSHTSRKTQEWCRVNLASFWPSKMWPPSSPDLNPLDYSV